MNKQPLSQEQALATWTELQRLISVGAFEERNWEHYFTGTWPEDGIEESVFNLEEWAARQGLEFLWHEESGSWSLEPMSEETKAARQTAQESQGRQGECVECGRFSSQLTEKGYCEGCVMQAMIDAQKP